MTDRVVVYAGSGVQDTDLLRMQLYARRAFSYMNRVVLGHNGIITGFIPFASVGMSVVLDQGAIHCGLLPEDAAALGSQPPSGVQITPIGVAIEGATVGPFPVPPAAGQSANHLICCRYVSTDTDLAVLWYQNAATGAPFRGVGNNGLAQPTTRRDAIELLAVFGAAATSSTQTTPVTPAGYIPMYVVTTNFGDTAILQNNIARHISALFLPYNLYETGLAINGVIAAAALTPNEADDMQLATAVGIIGTRQQSFYASGAFLVPPGVRRARAQTWGAGGGGGNGANGGGGGGSAGGYEDVWIDVVPNESLTIEVSPGGGYPGGPGIAQPGPTRVLRGGIELAGATSGNAGASGPSGAGDTAFGQASHGGGFGESGQNGLGVSVLMYGGQGGSAYGYKGGQAQLVGPSGNADGNGGQIGSGGGGGAGFGNGGSGGGRGVVMTY